MRRCLSAFASALALAAAGAAQAQTAQAQTAPAPAGWTFSLTPYLWLPTINSSIQHTLPNQVTVGTNSSVGPGDWLDKLHFALAFEAEAHYEKFSVITDFMYLDLGNSSSHIGSVNVALLPSNPISSAQQLGTTTSLQNIIWTQAAGYTLAQGPWGNIDAIGGFRMAAISVKTNYNLSVDVYGPRGNQFGPVFGGSGELSGTQSIWNAIAGVKGNITLGQTGFFLPYYLDAGTGGSQLTWQTQVGLGYQITSWADVAAKYRFMSFEQYDTALIRRLNMSGAQIEATFHF